jgi:nicotinate phosphoribosyltransferase
MNPFNTIRDEQIKTGRATDAYFLRTEEALEQANKNPEVVAEITADQFPTGEYEVFSGLQPAVNLLAQVDADIDVHAYQEGELFDGGPVMRIKGKYRDFARFETSLLGLLSHASGIATAALEATTAAEEKDVLSFGARHVHPSLAGVVERNALIGGADGFSHVAAGDMIYREPSGTMPHALMLAFNEDTPKKAFKAFDEAAPEDVPRIALCDTKTDEVVEVEQAVEALGEQLDGVRLDTTGSRRGDFRHIIKEVKRKLKELDREDVDILYVFTPRNRKTEEAFASAQLHRSTA